MKVTIIIPYNIDRGYLSKAIQSVKMQDYPDIELIVEQGNGPWTAQANRAIKKSSGELIRYLHEDDQLWPNSISETVRFFEKKESDDIDFIHSKAVNFWPNKGASVWAPKYEVPTFEQMYKENGIHGGTVVYRRGCFDNRMFDESLTSSEEYEFNLSLLYNKYKIGYIPTFTYVYRRHDLQKSLGEGVDQQARDLTRAEIKKRFSV